MAAFICPTNRCTWLRLGWRGTMASGGSRGAAAGVLEEEEVWRWVES